MTPTERYATDPVFREKALAHSRKQWAEISALPPVAGKPVGRPVGYRAPPKKPRPWSEVTAIIDELHARSVPISRIARICRCNRDKVEGYLLRLDETVNRRDK